MMEIHNFPSSLSMNGAGQKDEFGVVEIDDESVAVDTEVVLCTILEADSGVEVLIDGLGTTNIHCSICMRRTITFLKSHWNFYTISFKCRS